MSTKTRSRRNERATSTSQRRGSAVVLLPFGGGTDIPAAEMGPACQIFRGLSARDVIQKSLLTGGGAPGGWSTGGVEHDVVVFAGLRPQPNDQDDAIALGWLRFNRPSDCIVAHRRVSWLTTVDEVWQDSMGELLRAEWDVNNRLAEEGDSEPAPAKAIVVWPLQVLMPGQSPALCARCMSEAAFGFVSVLSPAR